MCSAARDSVQTHYDQVSPAWRFLMGDDLHYGYFASPDAELAEATAELTRQMLGHAEVERGHHVLDVGCGIGGPALFLARSLGCRVTGISTSRVGVERARASAAQQGLSERVTFLERDGMSNGFDDRSFDRVWVMESSHLMPDKAAMIRDSARTLRAQGKMVLCDIVMHRDLALSEVVKRAETFDLLRRVFGRAKMATLGAYEAWFESAGLDVVCLRDMSTETAPTFDRWQQNAERHRGAIVERMGSERLEEFVRACDRLKGLWDEGVLGYGLVEARARY